jgi:hypothetical protein
MSLCALVPATAMPEVVGLRLARRAVCQSQTSLILSADHSSTPRRKVDADSIEHHRMCSRDHGQLYKRRYEETESTAATDLISAFFRSLTWLRSGPQLLQGW